MAINLSAQLRTFAVEFNRTYERFLCRHIKHETLRRRTLYAVNLIGVRERAFLTRTAAQLCGVKWSDARPIAVAAECFMAGALTADDVLDSALTRWHKPSAYARWGDDQTWLIAEVLHGLAHTALENLEPVAAAPVRLSFRRCVEGQYRDILPRKTQSRREAVDLAMERTGALIQACLVAPALLGHSPYVKPLSVFGEHLGTAFQLADDIWDFVGDPRIMGKPILGDLLNGQPNIVLAHALGHKEGPDKRAVLRWYGKGTRASPGNPERIVAALTRLGSLQYAQGVVEQHLARGWDSLQDIRPCRPRRVLEAFVRLIAYLPVPHDRC